MDIFTPLYFLLCIIGLIGICKLYPIRKRQPKFENIVNFTMGLMVWLCLILLLYGVLK